MKKLAFGLMRLPQLDENDVTSIDIQRVKGLVDMFMEQGFTYFDTATPYHGQHSEIALREAVVKRYPRESYTVADKLTIRLVDKKENMQDFFDAQLERSGLDYFDIYLLHALDMEYYEKVKKFGAFEFLAEKKAEGKIKHIAFSFHDSPEVLDLILTEHPEVEFVQLQINYLDWEDERVQSRRCYEVAVKHGKKILVMEPVKGGALAKVSPEVEKLMRSYHPDASPASWAIRFAASLENVVMVLSGMSNEEQIADNTSIMKDFQPLNKEEMDILEQAAEIIRNDIAIGCTGCAYCVEDCPKNIAIPDYFKLYNHLKQFQETSIKWDKQRYNQKTEERGKASDCIECGLCEGHCPQHLQIRALLKDVADVFED
ncbi:MAG: aldo/keto reductase [Agathobacter sp.]|nr:aldo/keto reductase [Agathobacter sp.]